MAPLQNSMRMPKQADSPYKLHIVVVATRDPRCALNHAAMPVVLKFFSLMPLASTLTFEGSADATRAFSMVFNTPTPHLFHDRYNWAPSPSICCDAEAEEFQMRQYV